MRSLRDADLGPHNRGLKATAKFAEPLRGAQEELNAMAAALQFHIRYRCSIPALVGRCERELLDELVIFQKMMHVIL